MAKRISKYIDIEASESGESDYSEVSENIGPSDESIPESVSTHSEVYQAVATAAPTHSLLPRGGPKLFLLRVKLGKETQVQRRIAEGKKVFSVIVKDGLKGYVYVEADNKSNVVGALEGVRFASKNRLSLVPSSEMIDALSSTKPELEKGKFARVKSGKYKDDIVQVIEVDGSENVRVKMVPRIEGVKKLFEAEKYGASHSRGYFIYKKDCYKDGFLEKEMFVKNLVPTNEVSLDELEIFNETKPLKINNPVRVSKGELRDMVGEVTSVKKDRVVVKTKEGEFTVEADAIKKNFMPGDEVSVRDQNGVVVNVKGDEVVVLINMEKEIVVKMDLLELPVFRSAAMPILKRRTRIKRDELLNKEIEIMVGEFKGYKAIVKDVYNDECRVQLNTNLKEISIPKNKAKIIASELRQELIDAPYKTPVYKKAGTPGYYTPGYKTPGYKTPGYKTPGYKTPGNRTPGYKTPGYKTPTYKTPTDRNNYRQDYSQEMGVETAEGSGYKGALVVINGKQQVLKDICNEKYITDGGEYSKFDVCYVAPHKYDKVCILDGEEQGKNGLLVDLNNEIGVVRTADGSVVTVPFKNITKLV